MTSTAMDFIIRVRVQNPNLNHQVVAFKGPSVFSSMRWNGSGFHWGTTRTTVQVELRTFLIRENLHMQNWLQMCDCTQNSCLADIFRPLNCAASDLSALSGLRGTGQAWDVSPVQLIFKHRHTFWPNLSACENSRGERFAQFDKVLWDPWSACTLESSKDWHRSNWQRPVSSDNIVILLCICANWVFKPNTYPTLRLFTTSMITLPFWDFNNCCVEYSVIRTREPLAEATKFNPRCVR